jgi:fructose-bisphosphate aldolase class II
VKQFVALAHPLGISVEAEIGAMPNNMAGCANGKEKSDLSYMEAYFTNPQEAALFAERTGVDALAISFGTVHGSYEGEPHLDIGRVKQIRSAIPAETDLVMHGGSGTGEEQTRRAIDAGIRKINYFTAMDTAPAPVLLDVIEQAKGTPVHYGRLAKLAMEIMEEKVKEAMLVFLNGRSV